MKATTTQPARSARPLRLVGDTDSRPTPPHYEDIAAGLRALNRGSVQGSIVGLCYVVIGANGSVQVGALGAARTDRAMAHLGAAQLADALLWEE